MSVEAMVWALKHSRSTGTTRCVLMGIANQASDVGTNAWPSHATLAKHANTSVSSVKRAITWLRDNGEIIVEVGAGGTAECPWDRRPNRYTVIMTESAVLDPGSDLDPGSPTVERGSAGDTDPGPALDYNPSLTRPDPPIAPTEVDTVEISLRDAMIKACGLDSAGITRSAEGALAKAVREIADVGGTATQVPAKAAAFVAKFPHATLTPLALAKHWGFSSPAGPVPALSEAQRFGIALGRSEPDRVEAEDAIRTQYEDTSDRATALTAWERTRRQEGAA